MFENLEVMQRIAAFAVVFSAVMIFLFFWGRREKRRYRAIEVAEKLEEWGMSLLAKLFRAYAVGNIIGENSVGRCIREIIEEIKGGGLPAMLRKVAWKVVEGVFLKNDDDRARLTELLAMPKPKAEPEPPAPSLSDAV